MSKEISRREALKQLAASSAAAMFAGTIRGGAEDIVVAGQPVEIAVWSLSPTTVRIVVRPIENGAPVAVPVTGALEREEPGTSVVKTRDGTRAARIRAGD